VEDAVDVAAGIKRQALDPVLRVIGKEKASLIAAGKLRSMIDEPRYHRRVAPIVRIEIGRRRIGGVADWCLDGWPSRVWAPRAHVDLFDRRRVLVPRHVTDDEASGWRIVVGAERVAQTERPDRVEVWPGIIIEGIVGRYGSIHVEAQDLAACLCEILCFDGVEMLA